jgi:hypothetical protein
MLCNRPKLGEKVCMLERQVKDPFFCPGIVIDPSLMTNRMNPSDSSLSSEDFCATPLDKQRIER